MPKHRGLWFTCRIDLERVTQTQLECTLEVLIHNLAERLRGRVYAIHVVPVRMVREVIELRTERDHLPFADLEILEQRSGPILEARIVQKVAIVLRGVRAGIRLGECGRIEV